MHPGDYSIENHKSATSMTEEVGIDTNTVCRWVRDYRRKHNLPSYAEENGKKRKLPQFLSELKWSIKELEKAIKEKEVSFKRERRKSVAISYNKLWELQINKATDRRIYATLQESVPLLLPNLASIK